MGVLDAQGGTIPANVEALFPVWDDVSTWNINALSPISRRFQMGIGNFQFYIPRHVGAFWVQDDWVISPRITLNLGVRYDVARGMWAEDVELRPFVEAGRPIDKNNIAPRAGLAFSLNDRTVIRGGFGTFFGDITDQPACLVGYVESYVPKSITTPRHFAINPFNGPTPSFEQSRRRSAPSTERPTCVRGRPPGTHYRPVNDELRYQRSRRRTSASSGGNATTPTTLNGQSSRRLPAQYHLTYDPATGINYPFQDIAGVLPRWGVVEAVLP